MAASVLLPSVYALNPHPQMINIDNVIIGSGYGGAVTALRLCQAGHKCTILEMGVNWSTTGLSHKPFSNMLRPKSNSTWLKRKTIAPFFNIATFKNEFTGVLDRVDYENIKVYLGRGVGGGSLVNGGMAVTPNPQYFSEVFPDLNKDDFYNTYFPRAQQQLQINKIAPDFYKKTPFYKFARVGEAEAKKAGFTTVGVPNVYDFQYMEKEDENEVPRSAFNKELLYGNNYGKKSLDKSYLDEALKTGFINHS
ncbi:MAG: NAD(P)-binding protein [Ferruginibacter sp.]